MMASLQTVMIQLGPAMGTEFAGMTRFEWVLVLVAVLTAGYSTVRLWAIIRQETVDDRLAAWKIAPDKARSADPELEVNAVPSPVWYERLGAAIAATMFVGKADRERLALALGDAGLRGGRGWLATLVALKLAALVVVGLMAWFAIGVYGWFAHTTVVRFIVLLGAVLVGWRLPDIGLFMLARRRKRKLESSLPDALDLLVISAEAGLSLEQGVDFVAREMAQAMPELGQELQITSAELRVLGDRRAALHSLAKRIDLPAVRSIVATLMQTMRYGTPLAQSLRILAAEMRTVHLLRMEERAARMPVLLTLPLMCFILPSLVLVVIGPAILQAIDGFRALLK